ncbi:hypothetical protein TcBrA4_0065600 [Trypanosoma cruzi]|nr:hypothetical protein TcBrA4_0065600 [Trypanosoma cruzi]
MDRDTPEHWRAFADTVMRHFRHLQDAVVLRGMSVKEWELEELQRDGAGGGGVEESSVAHAPRFFDRGGTAPEREWGSFGARASLSSGEAAWRAWSQASCSCVSALPRAGVRNFPQRDCGERIFAAEQRRTARVGGAPAPAMAAMPCAGRGTIGWLFPLQRSVDGWSTSPVLLVPLWLW